MKEKEILTLLEDKVYTDVNVDISIKYGEIDIELSKSRFDSSYSDVVKLIKLPATLKKIDPTATLNYANKSNKIITILYKEKKSGKIVTQKIDIKFITKQSPILTTKTQEDGSVWIFNRSLIGNVTFESLKDVKNDPEYLELKKIFNNKHIPTEWFESYLKQNKKITERFKGKEWEKIEYKESGDNFTKFIKTCLKKVYSGRYETWNPSDIWIVRKDKKSEIKDILSQSIQGKPKTQTLSELNDILRNLIKKEYLIGVSLKKVTANQARFVYVNMKDFLLNSEDMDDEYNVDKIEIEYNMYQKGTKEYVEQSQVTLDKNKIQIKSNSGSDKKISNLKFESNIKDSGGRGGKAPVDLVETLLDKKFENNYSKYPNTLEEFKKQGVQKKYETLFVKIKRKRVKTDIKNRKEFSQYIEDLFNSDETKNKNIAISKLMQLEFLSEALEQKDQKEFWTDMLYISLKKNRKLSDIFAPHGKLF
jgi:hypothetical protein